MRDNEQGKRYGRRDQETKRIIEAFGFDLSPLALRYEEFVRVATSARVERERMRKLRRRATLARRAIAQAGEELAAQEAKLEGWRALEEETAALAVACHGARRSDELLLVVEGLERRKIQAEEWVRKLVQPVNNDPEGLASEPHQYTVTTLTAYPKKDTVIAHRDSSCPAATQEPQAPSPGWRNGLFTEALGLTPGHLLELAPRLSPYITPEPTEITWPAIVDAADWLGGGMGISRTLWARACQVMGRPYAAVAIAWCRRAAQGISRAARAVLRRHAAEIREGRAAPGGTLWALREAKWGKRRKSVH